MRFVSCVCNAFIGFLRDEMPDVSCHFHLASFEPFKNEKLPHAAKERRDGQFHQSDSCPKIVRKDEHRSPPPFVCLFQFWLSKMVLLLENQACYLTGTNPVQRSFLTPMSHTPLSLDTPPDPPLAVPAKGAAPAMGAPRRAPPRHPS